MKKIIVIIASVVVIAGTIAYFRNSLTGGKNGRANATPTLNPASDPYEKIILATYKNTRDKYVFRVPNTWKITEEETRTHFQPRSAKEAMGSMMFISINRKPAYSGQMTTPEEFNGLATRNPEDFGEDEPVQKIDEAVVSGQKTMVLTSAPGEGYEWSMTAWLMKDNENYYVNAQGTKKISDIDLEAFDYILANFSLMP